MNNYNADKTHVIDASGKEWACNVWHPLLVPKGIDDISAWSELDGTITYGHRHFSAYWLVSYPLPEPPKLKSQAELDEEAFGICQRCGAKLPKREPK